MKRVDPKTGKKLMGGAAQTPYAGREIEIAIIIAARLSKGEPYSWICRDEGIPAPATLLEWQQKYPEVGKIIASARVDGFDAIAAECLAIADEAGHDYGEEGFEPEHVSRAKLRVETRLKLLAKWDPKRYGDAGQNTTVNVGVTVNKTPEEKRRAIAEIYGRS